MNRRPNVLAVALWLSILFWIIILMIGYGITELLR